MEENEATNLSISPDLVKGNSFWWNSSPDFDSLTQSLKEQSEFGIQDEFTWNWNLGKDGMPIVVQIVGDHTQECRFWFGPDNYEDVKLSHRQDFGDVVRSVGIHGKINLKGKNEIKTKIVNFPKVIEIEQDGNNFIVDIANANSCTVLMAR